MGIPAYFKTIAKKYPEIITHKKQECSRLFLDLNCAIHTCANFVLTQEYVENTEQLERDIIRHTIEYIRKITLFVQPQELLYIAIDGIPPRAKIVQQRKRRYVSAWRNELINKAKSHENSQSSSVGLYWDNSAITPGTTFMKKLNSALFDHTEKIRTETTYEIIFSDSDVPGEGEAKILHHIKTTDIPQNADMIYGLDADLIMLGLLAEKHRIFLVREPVHYEVKNQTHPFLLLDIPLLRKYIAYDVVPKEFDEMSEETRNNIVWDYVVMCFFQGNDFIPPLSFLKIRDNGIDILLEVYKRIQLKNIDAPKHIVYKNNEIFYLDYDVLVLLLAGIKDVEDEAMYEAEKKYYTHQTHHIPFHNRPKKQWEKLANELDNYPTHNKHPPRIQPQKKGWRVRYYNELFDVKHIGDIDKICLNYMEGIQWTFNYYFNDNTSPSVQHWYFKYLYSPTILDAHNYMVQLSKSFTKPCGVNQKLDQSIKENFPEISYDTDLQLLMCLPPASRHLLRPQLSRIMTDISLGCLHMYPHTFKLTTYLKTYLWESYPILPPLDMEKLAKIKDELVQRM